MAVSVDGVKPISCASRLIHEPVIRLRSLRIKSNSSNSSGSEDSSGDVNALNDVVSKRVAYEGDCVDCTSVDSFADVSNPHAAAALLKAVMIVLGVISLPSSDFNENSKKLKRSELSDQLLSRFGGGIEIACVSALPAGSGMGGSSILAAAVLKSLATLLGLPCSNDTLIYQVLRVEQILTTNGGWQDQVGAIYGGFKIARSPASLPLHVTVDPVPMSDLFLKQFQSRCVLIFTGTQRLAKDTLINALHKHALTPSKIQTSNIIYLLRRHAESAASALMQRQLSKDTNMDDVVDELGGVLSHYWMLKRAMAEGCEPPYISRLMHHLRNLCVGISLCGAGAGGFLVAILNTNVSRQMLQDTLDIYANEEISLYQSQPLNLSTHHVIVDNEGITTQIYENSQSNDLTDYLFA